MTKIYQEHEYLLSIIRDNFSISLQLYYYDNNITWEKYSDTCVLLISQLQSFSNYESIIKSQLINLVEDLSTKKDYSVWVT